MTCEANVCGTGGWSGPKPGDPDNNSILSATPAFGGIDVSWTYPSTNPFAVAHVLVYRGVSADYMGAIYLATVSGSLYYDKTDIEMPIEYFYWIRLVSINGTYGELIGPASAVARPSIERTIEQLTGKIDAGVLAQSLRAELDQISILNGNLLDEITARENGEITLAQALADVDGGVAQALTFIHEEISSRVTADSAQAENLNLVAATLGDEMAAVTTSMTAEIDAVTGTVNAMYTAKVNVNGLIGGFGLANNGTTVQAGFDVDTFWVGRTNGDKVKPFVIIDGVVYMDDVRIRTASIGTLKIADNAVTAQATVQGAAGASTNMWVAAGQTMRMVVFIQSSGTAGHTAVIDGVDVVAASSVAVTDTYGSDSQYTSTAYIQGVGFGLVNVAGGAGRNVTIAIAGSASNPGGNYATIAVFGSMK